MEENETDITALIEKYEQMRALGRNFYFDADEFALLAEYYNAEGDNDEAEQLIREGLRMHPGSSGLMLLRAKTLVFAELYEEALEYLRLISDEGGVEHALLRIESMLHLEQYDDADRLINETLEEDLVMDDLYYFITEAAYLLNDLDKFDRAITFLEESMKIDDTNVDAIVDLAYAYEMKGDLEKAIEQNNRLLDIDPYSYDGWVNIGKLYSMNGQYDKAIDAFDFALTIREDDLPVMKMKALSLYLNDNVREAVAIFEQCLNKAPGDESLYDSLLEAYEAMEQYDEMMKLIDKKEALFGNEGVLAKRAFVHMNREEIDKAKELFEQIPDAEKETLDYYMLEGELAFHDNDLKRAETAYMKAALISEGNEEILDRLVNISVAQEKFEQAAVYLEELLEIAPDFPTAKSRLAFIRFEIGSKEPFDEIMAQFSDEELRALLSLISGSGEAEYPNYSREKMLTRLNEARENRVLFKNIKY
ncbi:MAG: tetratricopeptide repeat protein [Proteiniphilum sp.]|jgi:tetratricopeptide (TPR) repeat protein|nr:tetratricopeptide repeat protein [Proteiniphilum sp.]HHT34195.1 tetratricopeptide repeat protein [Bacteroidales bacterium]MDD2727112.1 tetratricopeptide repeat protein [Proteiniphilum sp.]MDD3332995.1 tetratricopeptide repeat protein [Proteiniphilum sp.]MDD3979890.1 tetratricopeptide repeat protein [Proteiniphilum sp.]